MAIPADRNVVQKEAEKKLKYVKNATSTHTPQDRHLATLRTPYAAFVKEIITSIAPEDGHVSPKHLELK